MPGEVITAMLVDEDALFRRGLRDLLEYGGVRVLAVASDAEEAESTAAELGPDVVVLAAGRSRTPAAEAVGRIQVAAPDAAVVVLAEAPAPGAVVAAIRAGADGFLLKEEGPSNIVAAVHAASGGGAPLSPTVARQLLVELRSAPDLDGDRPELTARERLVLTRLAAGCRNGEIAEELSISVYTVKRHVSHLLGKLGVENRTQAAVEATRRGLL